MKSSPSQTTGEPVRLTSGSEITDTSIVSTSSLPQLVPLTSSGLIVNLSSNVPEAVSSATKVGNNDVSFWRLTPEASGTMLHCMVPPTGLTSACVITVDSPEQIEISLPKSANGVLIIFNIRVSKTSLHEPSL